MKKNPHRKYRSLKGSVIVLLLFSLFLSTQLYANGEIKDSFGFRNASIEQVIKKVEKIFSIQFTYDPAVIAAKTKIDLPKKERTLEETLQQLSGLTGLQFMQAGKLVGIQGPGKAIKNVQKIRQEKVIIKGKVTDDN